MPGRGYTERAGQSQAASATETNIDLDIGANILVQVDRIRVGQSTHTTSEQYQVKLQRTTAQGTGTAGSPEPDEPSNGAPASTDLVNDSAEPTYTGSEYIQQAWNSLTGRDIVQPPGKEFYIGGNQFVGSAVITPSGTTTFTPDHEIHFYELG